MAALKTVKPQGYCFRVAVPRRTSDVNPIVSRKPPAKLACEPKKTLRTFHELLRLRLDGFSLRSHEFVPTFETKILTIPLDPSQFAGQPPGTLEYTMTSCLSCRLTARITPIAANRLSDHALPFRRFFISHATSPPPPSKAAAIGPATCRIANITTSGQRSF